LKRGGPITPTIVRRPERLRNAKAVCFVQSCHAALHRVVYIWNYTLECSNAGITRVSGWKWYCKEAAVRRRRRDWTPRDAKTHNEGPATWIHNRYSIYIFGALLRLELVEALVGNRCQELTARVSRPRERRRKSDCDVTKRPWSGACSDTS
jgi:hypothetical protein